MSEGEAAGTTYDGATALLTAATPVSPGAHTLYLSIFDQGDTAWDSAAFVDNLRIGFAANPQDCAQGAQPVNHPPDAVDDPLVTDEGVAKDVDVLANDTDEDGDGLSVTGWTNGANGTVSCTAAGICTYTPNPGFSGSDTFTYTISDGLDEDTATVNVTVNPATPTGGLAVVGHGQFNTSNSGRVNFELSSTEVTLTRTRGAKFTFVGAVSSISGGGHTALLEGAGIWNGQAGYEFSIGVVDNGSPGRRVDDTIAVEIVSPTGAVVFSSNGPERLKPGNITVTETEPDF
jgi:hypothetical protein